MFDLHVFSIYIVLLEQLVQNTPMKWTEFETCKHMRIYAHTQKGYEQEIAFNSTPQYLQQKQQILLIIQEKVWTMDTQ